MLGMLIKQALEEARDAHQPEVELGKRLAYVVSHGARALATLGGDVVSAALDEGRLALAGWREERRFLEHGPPCFDPSGDFDRDDDREELDYGDDPQLLAALEERDAERAKLKEALAERDEARILLQASRDYTAQRMEELRQLRATSVDLGAQLIGATAERDQAVAAHAAAVEQAAEAAAVGLANERRLLAQLQRLEGALTTEQGLRASVERAVMEEQELAVQLRVRESTLREEVADLTKTRTKQRECILQLRADLAALDQAARDVSAAAVVVEGLDTAFTPAIAKLRDVLVARTAP